MVADHPIDRGLSPRVRGSRPDGRDDEPDRGSIPACAGEPKDIGELIGGGRGLSPRVRGSPMDIVMDSIMEGSIPACAGEPRSAACCRSFMRVYPRVCGGARKAIDLPVDDMGLSPRVRGSRGQPAERHHRPGSIPACAGEPRTAAGWPTSARVYPRVCGGACVGRLQNRPAEGLSPRVRGSRGRWKPRVVMPGSIPACAGEP